MRRLNDTTDSMDTFERTLGDGEGQGSLAVVHGVGKQLDTTE